jgi:hypothetical protein
VECIGKGKARTPYEFARLVNGHPNRDIDQLLSWAYRKQDLRAVA